MALRTTREQHYVGRTNGLTHKTSACKQCLEEQESFEPNLRTVGEDVDCIQYLHVSRTPNHMVYHRDNQHHRVYFTSHDGVTRRIVGYGPRYNEGGRLAEESQWCGLGRCCALTPRGQCCNYIDARFSPDATCEREILKQLHVGLCTEHGRIFKRDILWSYEDYADHVAHWDDRVARFACDIMNRIHSLPKKKVQDWIFFSDVGQQLCEYMATLGFYTERTAQLGDLAKFRPQTYGARRSDIQWFGTSYIQEEIDLA